MELRARFSLTPEEMSTGSILYLASGISVDHHIIFLEGARRPIIIGTVGDRIISRK